VLKYILKIGFRINQPFLRYLIGNNLNCGVETDLNIMREILYGYSLNDMYLSYKTVGIYDTAASVLDLITGNTGLCKIVLQTSSICSSVIAYKLLALG
jgi:hypothetical protein